MVEASAPGKIILFGEHAVVYGRPAIAVPLSQLRATAVIQPNPQSGVQLIAPDLGMSASLQEAVPDDPLAAAIHQIQRAANIAQWPDMIVTVSSQIPIASGLGSGAAITAAILRALAQYLDLPYLLTDEQISALTYEVEKIHHGTPSGIDNTVVAYERPVYFVRRQPQNLIEPFAVGTLLRLLVADTGVSSSTKLVVGDVRRQWEADPSQFEALFSTCGEIAVAARQAIERGDLPEIGQLMTRNHQVLQTMTVSSLELDRLVQAAQQAGALGAKLSGAGWGGNMIALVTMETETAVRQALLQAGARHVLLTTLI
ncbi:MAG: mevalonate kinase [Ardenticatenaceae bacterium]|nr:mevalonate kinase [Ardenticatenaceae bacterium]MCB9005184.1 mevalonate kinase [Ardenticatenaceae bacterium]